MVLPQVSKPEDLQEVGSKIRFLRKEKKMSQLELAEAIGVTQNTIYLIETGQSEMKLGKLFSIAEVLDVTPDKLLPNEAKTTSNKLFEIEYLWKQLGEADQTIMHTTMLTLMKRMLQHGRNIRIMEKLLRLTLETRRISDGKIMLKPFGLIMEKM